jgi:inosine-uridine nucleoside N-ribohydrolase
MNITKIPVILDTDIGFDIDDTWALGLLLKCPEFDVKLITTTYGNTLMKAKLIAKFLEETGRSDIPIGVGPKNSYRRGPLFSWIKNYNLTKYPGIIYENGVESICNTIEESEDQVSLIAIGPLGNISDALTLNPQITDNSRFVGMHGSIRIGYAGSPTPHIEYNVLCDIQACRNVFEANWEKTITPLDTCGNIIFSGDNFKRILNCHNPVVEIIKECTDIWANKRKRSISFNVQKRTSILFDIVAVYLGFSEELVNIEDLRISVTGKGLTKIDEKGKTIRCATSWKDSQAFKNLIVDRLTD